MSQTTYTQDPSAAFPGMPADSGFKDDISCVVEETLGIDPGLLVIRGTGGDKTAMLPENSGADVDALKTNIASATSLQTFTGADFNGVIGTGRISPPAQITLTLSNNANWDATTATLIYEDEHGVRRTESLSIPDTGNTTLTSTGFATRVISLAIPTQSGTGGTATLGVSATRSFGTHVAAGEVLGVSIRTHKTRRDGSASTNEEYEDEAAMPVRRKGRVYVAVENAFSAGDRVFVRCIAGVGESLGAFRVLDTDSGDCVELPGARLLTSGSAGALGVLEVNF